MSAMIQIRCWMCGCYYERKNPAFESKSSLAGFIEGRYLSLTGEFFDKKGCLLRIQPGDFCAKCGSRLFAPANGQLAPVLGWAAVKTNPSEEEIRMFHIAMAPWSKPEKAAREAFDFLSAFKIIGDKLDMLLSRTEAPKEVQP